MEEERKTPQEVATFLFEKYYVDHDIDSILACCREDVTWIGPCDSEYLIGYPAVSEYFRRRIKEIPNCKVGFSNIDTVYNDQNHAIVMGRFVVSVDHVEDRALEIVQRFTLNMMFKENRWQIVHFHNSNIYEEMEEDEHFLKGLGHLSKAYLDRLLKEKNEVIEMITDNIDGGLKGSNDDEEYSFFYVNEGLCRMLGYSYQEFMEMSHGCAVGAVYPPDVEPALASVDKCFAKGPTYSCEYRIKKKDGTLLWVLDSGKKCLGSDGKVKINSIVMDVSALKEKEMELRLERERYRIALDNISDVMFEYDILNDRIVKYERKDFNLQNPLEEVTINHYFDTLEQGKYIHLDDIGKLKAFLCGEENPAGIEVRMFVDEDTWKWIRVTCSYIYEEENKPIRCIGIWSDITEEKLRIDSLIDLSKRDALTHLYNTKSSETMISEKMKKEDSGVLMILDIDHFKNVNDTFGHLKGNDILLAVRDLLNKHTKKEDIVTRVGGDEFLIYMNQKRCPSMKKCAQKILTDAHNIVLEGHGMLTLSMGIAYHRNQEEYNQLFKRADDALYIAKNSGRNQIVVDSQESE